jgi:hypothetical protein
MASSKVFFKRLLASTVAMASLTTIAARANADTNLVSFSTSSWTGKDTSVGDFGAGYGADFTSDLTTAGALTGEASANAQIQLFGATMTIVLLKADASINNASSDGASLYGEVVGATVLDESFEDGFTFKASDDLSNYEEYFCTEFFDVSSTITVGVVPVTMSAGAEGCANLSFSATPQYNTSTHEGTLNIEFTPSLTSDLTAALGVGTDGFSAGVEGTVTLLEFSIPVTLDPKYNFNTTTFSYDSTGQIDLTMLDGSVDLYAKADLGLFDVKYSKELFSWDGISKEWWLWSTGVPTASGAVVSIVGGKASGTYTYEDTAGTAEGSSSYIWYRSATGSDTDRSAVSWKQDHTIVLGDRDKYLQFCITPKNAMGTPGEQQCSDWESIGKVASFYENNGYSGTNLAIAYEKSTSGTCFNLEDSLDGFDNMTSSYKLYAPSDSSATFHFYKGFDCSDTSSTDYTTKSVSASGSNQQTSTSDLGSTWNDRLSSILVVFGETVSADGVTVSISGNQASAAYSFAVSNSTNTTESGSTYAWHRSSSSDGTSYSEVGSGSTYTLTDDDDQQYLQVCVTPSNGYTTGTGECSDWTAVGYLMRFYEDSSYGGDQIAIAWEKSEKETCFNLSTYSFNDKASSYVWYNNSVASTTVTFYKDADCSGTSTARTKSAGSSDSVSSISGTFGSSWQDAVSSFKVSWTSTISISTPSLTIYGNKATESHTYSDSSGLPESATYTWYRSFNGFISTIDNAVTNEYTLTDNDNYTYLKVCVHSSNGVMVDEYEQCTGWTYVGGLLKLYTDNDRGGASIYIAYESSPSGTCLKLSDFSFDDMTSSVRAYAPIFSSATFYLYRRDDCGGSSPSTLTASAYTYSDKNYSGTADNTLSSVKVVY